MVALCRTAHSLGKKLQPSFLGDVGGKSHVNRLYSVQFARKNGCRPPGLHLSSWQRIPFLRLGPSPFYSHKLPLYDHFSATALAPLGLHLSARL